jgi:signal transduction histidine kinase
MMARDDGTQPSWLLVNGGQVCRRLAVLLAWALWALVLLGLGTFLWLDHLLRQSSRPDLALLVPFAIAPTLAALTASLVGVVLASRRPRHPVGWLLLALGLALITGGVAAGYVPYGLVLRSRALPGAHVVARLYPTVTNAALAALGFILLLTPTGSPPSPRWRWWAWGSAAATALLLVATTIAPGTLDPVALVAGGPQDFRALGGALRLANQAGQAVAILTILGGTVSLVVRFRHARGVERLQLRWVALAAGLTGVGMLAVAVLIAAGEVGLAGWVAVLCVALLPLAAGAAILRYRLYDLDYLISRTVVYGLLTVVGVAVYVGVVKLSEWLLRESTGLGSSLLAAAIIAVSFAPARDRLQHWVDRRLYGDRHDPVRAVARLGQRLRDAPATGGGEDVLAGVLQEVCETLRLPSASLRVQDGVEVGALGPPASATESIPLEHEGQRIGALLVGVRSGEDALGAADRRVLEILAAPVAVAVHAVLLSRELQRSRERLVAAREEERRRLRRDLHDGLGPILTAVTLKADAARSTLATMPDRADGLLTELRGDAKQAIADLRRVIYDLRPALLDELGLLGALNQQVDRFARQGLSVTVNAPPTLPVLPAAVEVAAYRILTEALTNIARHAHARQVTIMVAIDVVNLRLEVYDDGTASTANGERWQPGVGLLSMAERVAEVGGTLQAGPTPTGGRVQASLPLEPI